MTNPPVPAAPLDVEACVRLLEWLIRDNQLIADSEALGECNAAEAAIARGNVDMLRALASALPGMGKLREVVHGWTGMDTAEEVDEWFVNNKADQLIAAHALSAARAAHPEETSADA